MARADEAALVGEDDGLDAAADVELGQQAGDMGLDRGLAEPELLRESGVGEPAGEAADDVALALGQRVEAWPEGEAGAGGAELGLDEPLGDRRRQQRVAL